MEMTCQAVSYSYIALFTFFIFSTPLFLTFWILTLGSPMSGLKLCLYSPESGLIKNSFIHVEQDSVGARMISESPCDGNMASKGEVLPVGPL